MAERGKVSRDWEPETMAILAGRDSNQGGLAPILWATTAFAYDSVGQGYSLATEPAPERFYSRYGNPTVNAFEATIAELEGAEASRAFASGMGAMSAVVMGFCSTGDHIVAQQQQYGGTQLLLQTVCPRFGIDVTFVDGTRPGAFAEAIRPGKTMLVIAETPANPYLDLVDLDEVGALVGPMTVVDSTFATPLGQQPIAHGVDLVLHSATKAIAGHNDATIGVVSGSEELMTWLWNFAVLHGANASPFDALNAHRGVRTLGVRLAKQSDSAQRLAEFLEGHGSVCRVAYPGLESHPQHHLAQRQMSSMGGLLTFDLAGGSKAGERFAESTSVAILASTLGGPETLITHPASTTHVGLTEVEQAATGIGPGTIRVSCGLEDSGDIVADFEGALAVAG